MICPICEKPMVEKPVMGVLIDYCENCGGLWLDNGELKKLSGLDVVIGRKLLCPECKSFMLQKTVSGVEVDVCARCKRVWLDGNELKKLSGVDPVTGKRDEVKSKFAESLRSSGIKL